MVRGMACWALVVALALAVTQARAANDEVKKTKGEPIMGTIVSDTTEGLKVTVAGGAGNMTILPSEIASVTWDIQSPEWLEGIRQMERGNFGAAAQAFNMITSDNDALAQFRLPAKPYLMFLVADCLYKAGQQANAVLAYEKFMAENKDSRYVPMALESLVDAAIQTKNFNRVPPLLEKLKAMGKEAKAKATYYGAMMDEAQGNTDAANAKYGESAASTEDPETRALGRLGQARCAIQKKEYAKAKQMAEQALKDSASKAVAGTAYLRIGDVLFETAAVEKPESDFAKEKYLDAILAYMRIKVLYPGDPRTEPEALFKLGECFRLLAKFPNRGADRDRAMSLYNEVISRYRNSRWAKEAIEAINKK